MKTKLTAALATKFQGVDAKILGRIADKILSGKTIENDDDVKSAVDEVTIVNLLESYGDSRATEATKTAVSNYEKKHKLKDGKPVEQKDGEDDGEGETQKAKNIPEPTANSNESKLMALLEKLSKQVEDQNREINSLKLGKVTEGRKAKMQEVLKDLKETQKKAYSRIPLDSYSDEEFDSFLEDVTAEVAELVRDNKASDTSSMTPPFGGIHSGPKANEDASDAEIDALVGKMRL